MRDTARGRCEARKLSHEMGRDITTFPAKPSDATTPGYRPIRPTQAETKRVPDSDGGPSRSVNGRRFVILEADDLGLLHAFNEGIRSAGLDGRLTSTCLRANGYAYEHALAEVLPACPAIGLGIHLCLNEGPSVAPSSGVPRLLGADGSLRHGFVWLMRAARTKVVQAQIERELRAQIEKVLAAGVRVDHLNSHQHVHMIPSVFRITCRLAGEYGIPCVRLVRELPYRAGGLRKRLQPLLNTNYGKHLLLNCFARINESTTGEFDVLTTDYFLGVNHTAHMDLSIIRRGLRAAAHGSIEVLVHPAIGPDPRDARYPHRSLYGYVTAPQRAAELHALSVPAFASFLEREAWTPTTFGAWCQARQAGRLRASWPEIPEVVRRICRTTPVDGPPWVSAAQDDSRVFAELAAAQAGAGQRVLDLGTGTGIVAICLAKAGRRVVAADISVAALRTAAANAARNEVSFETCRSDLLGGVEGRFDLIAFNLPYGFRPDTFTSNLAKNFVRRLGWVRRCSGLAMPRPVLRFHQELVARLVKQAPAHLNPGGALLLHAYESEVAALGSVLPRDAHVELLHHAGLANHTVGMLIRLPASIPPEPTGPADACAETIDCHG